MSPPFPLPIGFFFFCPAAEAAERIVTSDLALHLDAADAASYGGSGTTWSDLTSNNYDFTFASAPSLYSITRVFQLCFKSELQILIQSALPRGTAIEVWFRWDLRRSHRWSSYLWAATFPSQPDKVRLVRYWEISPASALPSESIEFNHWRLLPSMDYRNWPC